MDARLAGAPGKAEGEEIEALGPKTSPFSRTESGLGLAGQELAALSAAQRHICRILSAVMAAVMLLALAGLAAAVSSGLGELAVCLLIGIAGVSGGVAVLAARRGWRT